MSALSILSVSVFKNCIAMDMLLFILHPTGNCEISRKQEISLFQTGRIDCKLTFLKKKLPVFKLTWKEKSKQIYPGLDKERILQSLSQEGSSLPVENCTSHLTTCMRCVRTTVTSRGDGSGMWEAHGGDLRERTGF